MGGPLSGFLAVWSELVEQQAEKNSRPGALSPRVVREQYGPALSPTGRVAGRFEATAETDRQILADAEAAGALFLVTEDVDDFDETDLESVGISAVNHDRFLATWLAREPPRVLWRLSTHGG
jgi:hypothetical protein